MYAIMETGGKQYTVRPDQVLRIEKLDGEVGDVLEFSNVLFLSNDGDCQVGKPFLENAKVKAEIVRHGRDEKKIIFRFVSKEGIRNKKGHRQPHTIIKITEIEA